MCHEITHTQRMTLVPNNLPGGKCSPFKKLFEQCFERWFRRRIWVFICLLFRCISRRSTLDLFFDWVIFVYGFRIPWDEKSLKGFRNPAFGRNILEGTFSYQPPKQANLRETAKKGWSTVVIIRLPISSKRQPSFKPFWGVQNLL